MPPFPFIDGVGAILTPPCLSSDGLCGITSLGKGRGVLEGGGGGGVPGGKLEILLDSLPSGRGRIGFF